MEDKRYSVSCGNCKWFEVTDYGCGCGYSCSPKSLPKNRWDYINGWERVPFIPREQNGSGDCQYWSPNLLTRILNFFKKQ